MPLKYLRMQNRSQLFSHLSLSRFNFQTPSPAKKDLKRTCFWVLLCTLFIVVLTGSAYGLLSRMTFVKSKHSSIGQWQTSVRSVVQDFSSYMCTNYNMSMHQNASVFLVPGAAKLSSETHSTIVRHSSKLLPHNPSLNNSFYLLKGSHIHVTGCRNPSKSDMTKSVPLENATINATGKVEMYLIKGYRSWSDFIEKEKTDRAILAKTIGMCDDGQTSMEFKVKDKDTYFVAFDTKDTERTTVIPYLMATLVVNRTIFDTSAAIQTCNNTKDCSLNLQYAKDLDAVLIFPEESSAEDTSFISECIHRNTFWTSMFVVLPVLLLLAIYCVFLLPLLLENIKFRRKVVPHQKMENVTTSPASDDDILVENEFEPGMFDGNFVRT